MKKYESPTIEMVGGVSNADPKQLVWILFAAIAIFVTAAMYALAVDIAIAYDTVLTPSRNINQ